MFATIFSARYLFGGAKKSTSSENILSSTGSNGCKHAMIGEVIFIKTKSVNTQKVDEPLS